MTVACSSQWLRRGQVSLSQTGAIVWKLGIQPRKLLGKPKDVPVSVRKFITIPPQDGGTPKLEKEKRLSRRLNGEKRSDKSVGDRAGEISTGLEKWLKKTKSS
jgi:hypothetical protein